jgi:RNA polymerase sigma factor (sigma-70 family)
MSLRLHRPDGSPVRSLAIAVALVLVGAFVMSLFYGTPSKLPGIAMGWPLLLHILRACLAAVLVGAVAVVIMQLWRGELPSKVSTAGIEWPESVTRADRDVQEQLLRVERESKAAMHVLAAQVIALATRTETQLAEDQLERALGRWDDALSAAERKEQLAAAIAALPDNEKLVVGLTYYEGMKEDAVAEILATTLDRVRTLRTRAVQKLRKQLGAEPFGEEPNAGAA